MRLQGLPVEIFRGGSAYSDSQLSDLAGNAFSSTVSLALDVAVLLCVDCGTSSDGTVEAVDLIRGIAHVSEGGIDEFEL